MDQIAALSDANARVLEAALARRLHYTGAAAVRWWEQVMSNFPRRAGAVSMRKDPATLLLAVGERFPVLRELWQVQGKRWEAYLERFFADASAFALRRGGLQGAMPEILEADCSDIHEGGRSVLRVRLADTSQWYYKPRCGDGEVAWFALLRWLNEEGFTPNFRLVEIVPEPNHFWMEAVTPKDCADRGEVALFYQRAGALLYLIERLRGVDFHAGNLIAAGPHPVIVDCETLLHPPTSLPVGFAEEETPLLRTGMLPIPSRQMNDSVSALGRSSAGPYRSQIGGRAVEVCDFVEEIVTGFSAMHRFLLDSRRRETAFQEHARQLKGCERRIIYRPTLWYTGTLQRSLAARLLRDAAERRSFLCRSCADESLPLALVEAEVRVLEAAEIPAFRACSVVRPASPHADIEQPAGLIRRSLGR